MFELSKDLRFYIFNGKTNLRGGYMRLCATIREEMGCDPRNENHVYIFINRKCTIIRMLHYERGFYFMYEKRPEIGCFRRPVYDNKSGKYKISYADLVCLTEQFFINLTKATQCPEVYKKVVRTKDRPEKIMESIDM